MENGVKQTLSVIKLQAAWRGRRVRRRFRRWYISTIQLQRVFRGHLQRRSYKSVLDRRRELKKQEDERLKRLRRIRAMERDIALLRRLPVDDFFALDRLRKESYARVLQRVWRKRQLRLFGLDRSRRPSQPSDAKSKRKETEGQKDGETIAHELHQASLLRDVSSVLNRSSLLVNKPAQYSHYVERMSFKPDVDALGLAQLHRRIKDEAQRKHKEHVRVRSALAAHTYGGIGYSASANDDPGSGRFSAGEGESQPFKPGETMGLEAQLFGIEEGSGRSSPRGVVEGRDGKGAPQSGGPRKKYQDLLEAQQRAAVLLKEYNASRHIRERRRTTRMFSLGHCKQLVGDLKSAVSLDEAAGQIHVYNDWRVTEPGDAVLDTVASAVGGGAEADGLWERRKQQQQQQGGGVRNVSMGPGTSAPASVASSSAVASQRPVVAIPETPGRVSSAGLQSSGARSSSTTAAGEDVTFHRWLADVPLRGMEDTVAAHLETMNVMKNSKRWGMVAAPHDLTGPPIDIVALNEEFERREGWSFGDAKSHAGAKKMTRRGHSALATAWADGVDSEESLWWVAYASQKRRLPLVDIPQCDDICLPSSIPDDYESNIRLGELHGDRKEVSEAQRNAAQMLGEVDSNALLTKLSKECIGVNTRREQVARHCQMEKKKIDRLAEVFQQEAMQLRKAAVAHNNQLMLSQEEALRRHSAAARIQAAQRGRVARGQAASLAREKRLTRALKLLVEELSRPDSKSGASSSALDTALLQRIVTGVTGHPHAEHGDSGFGARSLRASHADVPSSARSSLVREFARNALSSGGVASSASALSSARQATEAQVRAVSMQHGMSGSSPTVAVGKLHLPVSTEERGRLITPAALSERLTPYDASTGDALFARLDSNRSHEPVDENSLSFSASHMEHLVAAVQSSPAVNSFNARSDLTGPRSPRVYRNKTPRKPESGELTGRSARTSSTPRKAGRYSILRDKDSPRKVPSATSPKGNSWAGDMELTELQEESFDDRDGYVSSPSVSQSANNDWPSFPAVSAVKTAGSPWVVAPPKDDAPTTSPRLSTSSPTASPSPRLPPRIAVPPLISTNEKSKATQNASPGIRSVSVNFQASPAPHDEVTPRRVGKFSIPRLNNLAAAAIRQAEISFLQGKCKVLQIISAAMQSNPSNFKKVPALALLKELSSACGVLPLHHWLMQHHCNPMETKTLQGTPGASVSSSSGFAQHNEIQVADAALLLGELASELGILEKSQNGPYCLIHLCTLLRLLAGGYGSEEKTLKLHELANLAEDVWLTNFPEGPTHVATLLAQARFGLLQKSSRMGSNPWLVFDEAITVLAPKSTSLSGQDIMDLFQQLGYTITVGDATDVIQLANWRDIRELNSVTPAVLKDFFCVLCSFRNLQKRLKTWFEASPPMLDSLFQQLTAISANNSAFLGDSTASSSSVGPGDSAKAARSSSRLVSIEDFCEAINLSDIPLSETESYTLAMLFKRDKSSRGNDIDANLLYRIKRGDFLSMRLR